MCFVILQTSLSICNGSLFHENPEAKLQDVSSCCNTKQPKCGIKVVQFYMNFALPTNQIKAMIYI